MLTPIHNIFPSEEQVLLIKAIFDESNRTSYIQKWLKRNKDSNGNITSQILLHLRRELKDQNAASLYQQTRDFAMSVLGKNHLIFHYADNLIGLLKSENIDIILLKGAAMTEHYYHDLSVRPMVDLDIMVPYEQLSKVETVFRKHGWKPDKLLARGEYHYKHSLSWRNRFSFSVDLHWFLFEEACFHNEFNNIFWQHVMPVKFRGHDVFILDPTNQIFHLIVHGYGRDKQPDVRWLIDILAVIHHQREQIDWHRLIEIADRIRMSLILRTVLLFVHNNQLAEIPDNVLATLQSKKIPHLERWEFRDKTMRKRKKPRSALPYHFIQYYLRTKPSFHSQNSPGFWRFFMDIRGIKNLMQLPFYMISRLKYRFHGNNIKINIE